jgi:hypothetical protein
MPRSKTCHCVSQRQTKDDRYWPVVAKRLDRIDKDSSPGRYISGGQRAARTRLIRQLLTENVLLSIPAAMLALALSEATTNGALQAMFASGRAPPEAALRRATSACT